VGKLPASNRLPISGAATACSDPLVAARSVIEVPEPVGSMMCPDDETQLGRYRDTGRMTSGSIRVTVDGEGGPVTCGALISPTSQVRPHTRQTGQVSLSTASTRLQPLSPLVHGKGPPTHAARAQLNGAVEHLRPAMKAMVLRTAKPGRMSPQTLYMRMVWFKWKGNIC
jgi:hypothetical protein